MPVAVPEHTAAAADMPAAAPERTAAAADMPAAVPARIAAAADTAAPEHTAAADIEAVQEHTAADKAADKDPAEAGTAVQVQVPDTEVQVHRKQTEAHMRERAGPEPGHKD